MKKTTICAGEIPRPTYLLGGDRAPYDEARKKKGKGTLQGGGGMTEGRKPSNLGWQGQLRRPVNWSWQMRNMTSDVQTGGGRNIDLDHIETSEVLGLKDTLTSMGGKKKPDFPT